MTGDVLLALGGIETVGTLMGFSTGECERPSSALDASATGGTRDNVASNDRSTAILSAWYRQGVNKDTESESELLSIGVSCNKKIEVPHQ